MVLLRLVILRLLIDVLKLLLVEGRKRASLKGVTNKLVWVLNPPHSTCYLIIVIECLQSPPLINIRRSEKTLTDPAFTCWSHIVRAEHGPRAGSLGSILSY